jgi:carboxylesterase
MSATYREPVDPGPFDLFEGGEPAEAEAAALCLHGLTGTPYEVRSLGEALRDRGIRARGPLLPGHNSTPEALVSVPRGAWLSAVRDEYHRLREQHERVFVVGLSLGGVLGLALAQEEPVDALAVVGTPLALRQPIPLLIPLLKHVMPFRHKRGGSDIRDDEARSRHPSYDRMPLASVHELILLQREVRRRLSEVRSPIFVGHGAHDATASPRDAERIHGAVASERKELRLFENSGHIVPVDHDAAALAEAVANFLQAQVPMAGAGSAMVRR